MFTDYNRAVRDCFEIETNNTHPIVMVNAVKGARDYNRAVTFEAHSIALLGTKWISYFIEDLFEDKDEYEPLYQRYKAKWLELVKWCNKRYKYASMNPDYFKATFEPIKETKYLRHGQEEND